MSYYDEEIVSDEILDEDLACADCFAFLDDHCKECGECWCEALECQECEGHPAGPYDPMGEDVYCDGSCR